jgi:hypothetical protein
MSYRLVNYSELEVGRIYYIYGFGSGLCGWIRLSKDFSFISCASWISLSDNKYFNMYCDLDDGFLVDMDSGLVPEVDLVRRLSVRFGIDLDEAEFCLDIMFNFIVFNPSDRSNWIFLEVLDIVNFPYKRIFAFDYYAKLEGFDLRDIKLDSLLG